MIDWINAFLRAVMCLGFLILVVKPMLMVFTRREFNHIELEDAAQSSVNSAFQAWRVNHGTHYYDNPEYAEMMASNPNLELPDLSKPAESLPTPEAPTVSAEDSKSMEVDDKSIEEKREDKVADQSVSQEVALKDEPKNDESHASVEEVTEEEDSMDAMKAKLAAEKKKKKAQTVPPELLNNANTYEDKLMVVRLITEQDYGRVAAVLKKMIQGGV
jgi:type IV secretory pathway VirB10-like protein